MKKLFLILLLSTPVLLAQDTLTVGIYNFPPNVIIKDGRYPTGFDICVFEEVAKRAGINYKYKEYDNFAELLNGVEKSLIDVAAAAITITKEREELYDFTHSYLSSGLMICVNKDSKVSQFKIIWRYIINIGPTLAWVILFTLCCGIVIFFIERMFSKKDSMFNPDKPVKGIFNGFWFANVFSSTVGFGDFVPKSVPGKLVTIIMLFIGVYFIFPYCVASMQISMEQERSLSAINAVEDLDGKTISTERGTTSEGFLRAIDCNLKLTNNIKLSYDLLKDKQVDAVVFDMPNVCYTVKNKKKRYKTSGSMFDRQPYGFALSKDSPYREVLNQNLIEFIRTQQYWDLYNEWFGE